VRLSEKPIVAGLIIGLLVGAASWVGNASRTSLGIVSAFPDLLTVAAVPLALYFFVRARVMAPDPPDLRSLRRAGWAAVNAAALTLAVFLAAVARFWFNQFDSGLMTSTLAGGVIVTAGIGYASVEVWARLLLGARGGGHR
jgi:hypothetical protein